ncbi:MAG: DNA ligase [Pseudomonadota bacterium]
MPLANTVISGTRVLAAALIFHLLFSPITRAQPPGIPLASQYHQGVELEHYWLSEKLDGVRAYWDGERLWSRGGHQYRAPAWFTEGFPEHPLDGELWAGRGRFAELSGIVRKARPVANEWQQVRFHVFDLPLQAVPFSERYRRLQALVRAADATYLELVEQHPVTGHDELMAKLQQVVSDGAEGLMLKRIDSLYAAGRSDDLLKVKTHNDAEATVVGHLPGKGKYRGMLGALEVQLDNGRQFRIGTGFSDAERRNPPPVGALVTFRYRGYTATGLPRFASYLRVRNDEPEQLAID